MPKERNAPPVLHPDYALHMQWIDQNRPALIRDAQTRHQAEGRGAFMVDEEDYSAQAGTVPTVYMSDRIVQESGTGWPGETIAEAIRAYDPAGELLILFLTSGVLACYKVVFARRRPLVVLSA